MSVALWVVKIIRKLAHSRRLDTHLDHCAALEVFYGQFNENSPPLRLSHVFGITPLPAPNEGSFDVGGQRVHIAMLTGHIHTGRKTPEILKSRHLKHRSQSLH